MTKRGATRRDFLQGKAAADALYELTSGEGIIIEGPQTSGSPTNEPVPLAPLVGEGFLIEHSRRAMACTFQVLLNARQYPLGTAAALAALDLVETLEEQLSIFRASSELNAINATAGDSPVSVEPRLFALLDEAVTLAGESEGAYDLTSWPLTQAWGFARRAGRMPSAEELAEARALVGRDRIALDREEQSVSFTKPGTSIQLNSIGKGYALDRLREFLLAEGIDNHLLHGGQSSVLAQGAAWGQDHWTIGLGHPLRPERRIAEFYLRNESLATSGSATQFFHHQGRRYGHLIDPRTGWPAEGIYSATVIAPRAATADALSTAAYVLGVEGTGRYCAAHPEVSAIIVTPGSKAGDVDVHSWNLADDRWQCHG